MEKYSEIIKVSTGIGPVHCKYCEDIKHHQSYEDLVNHIINRHGFFLLHTGAETSNDSDGKPWHDTVYILGKE